MTKKFSLRAYQLLVDEMQAVAYDAAEAEKLAQDYLDRGDLDPQEIVETYVGVTAIDDEGDAPQATIDLRDAACAEFLAAPTQDHWKWVWSRSPKTGIRRVLGHLMVMCNPQNLRQQACAAYLADPSDENWKAVEQQATTDWYGVSYYTPEDVHNQHPDVSLEMCRQALQNLDQSISGVGHEYAWGCIDEEVVGLWKVADEE